MLKASIQKCKEELVWLRQEEGKASTTVELLTSFILNAESSLILDLEIRRDQALLSCKILCEYFCEEAVIHGDEGRVAMSLIGVLAQFATNIEAVIQKYHTNNKQTKRY